MRAVIISILCGAGALISMPAMAQDVSPTLLIETGPNDNPQYRRVVFVKYLQGNMVTANYRADNRTEFKRVGPETPQDMVDKCATGPATTLREIQSYAANEKRRASRKQEPEVRSFCIKNVYSWTARNKDAYLDPIFETMPYSIQAF